MLVRCLPVLLALRLFALVSCHFHKSGDDDDTERSVEELELLQKKWGTDYGFSGISTFAHLPHTKCLVNPSEKYDIAIIGAPFDTAVSYRPGARFGPRAIRAASARQTTFRGFNPALEVNPYMNWAKVIDCGDIPITPFDNALALQQMTEAMTELLHRPVAYTPPFPGTSTAPPVLVTLGGDHSIALAALRALNSVHGSVAVLHFDAHLDTWHPQSYPSHWWTPQSAFTHGTMFHLAHNESLLLPASSVHAGLRTRLSGDNFNDYEHDDNQGWTRISTDDIDDLGGPNAIAEKILEKMKGKKVYLSFDIDVIEPGLAPGTGTPEPGGWTTREVLRILRRVVGSKEVEVVGMDIVEVAPAYDGVGETTALAAAQVVYEVLGGIVKRGPPGKDVQGMKDEL